MIHNYYGRTNYIPIKPTQDIVHTMLDEHIAKILDKQAERFKIDCLEMIKELKKEALGEIVHLRKRISGLDEKIKNLVKDLEKKKILEALDKHK